MINQSKVQHYKANNSHTQLLHHVRHFSIPCVMEWIIVHKVKKHGRGRVTMLKSSTKKKDLQM